jgi:predicted metalloprotease
MEDVWVPFLVLFAEAVESACGFNSATVGAFYCRLDSQVSINQFCNGAA